MSTVIVDAGTGNLRSAEKAFARAAAGPVVVSGEAEVVAAAERLVLPGVGAFADCLAGLEARPGLREALHEAVVVRARPLLGICVGMQLLATRGHELGVHAGLDWIGGEVVPLVARPPAIKVPHMGWNSLVVRYHPLLAGIDDGTHMYFVHGYHFRPADPASVVATTDHGGEIAAMVVRDNVAGAQFHPEKSQAAGLRLIANFLAWRP